MITVLLVPTAGSSHPKYKAPENQMAHLGIRPVTNELSVGKWKQDSISGLAEKSSVGLFLYQQFQIVLFLNTFQSDHFSPSLLPFTHHLLLKWFPCLHPTPTLLVYFKMRFYN